MLVSGLSLMEPIWAVVAPRSSCCPRAWFAMLILPRVLVCLVSNVSVFLYRRRCYFMMLLSISCFISWELIHLHLFSYFVFLIFELDIERIVRNSIVIILLYLADRLLPRGFFSLFGAKFQHKTNNKKKISIYLLIILGDSLNTVGLRRLEASVQIN